MSEPAQTTVSPAAGAPTPAIDSVAPVGATPPPLPPLAGTTEEGLAARVERLEQLLAASERAHALAILLLQQEVSRHTSPRGEPPLPKVFWGELTDYDAGADLYAWTDTTSLDRYSDSATASSVGAAVEINGMQSLPAGTLGLFIEEEDVDHFVYRFAAISGMAGMFPVRVKANGVDGGGKPLYDVYAKSDVGLSSALNTDGALSPECSRARPNDALDPIAAADGSTGSAYRDTDGAVVLFDCAETICSVEP